MGLLNEWIDSNIAEIANKLPTQVHTEPSSFACGYNSGYKCAMLDLERFLDNIKDFPEEAEIIYNQDKFDCFGLF